MLQFWSNCSEPGVNTRVCQALLIDFIKRKSYELTVYYSIGGIERVSIGIDRTYEIGAAVLDIVVEFTYSAYKCVTV